MFQHQSHLLLTILARAWKELMPSLPAFLPLRLMLPKTRRKPSLNFLTWTNLVQKEKNTPLPNRRNSRRSHLFQSRSLMTVTTLVHTASICISSFLFDKQKHRTQMLRRIKRYKWESPTHCRGTISLCPFTWEIRQQLPFTFGTHLLRFSRATSILSPHLISGTWEFYSFGRHKAIPLRTSLVEY